MTMTVADYLAYIDAIAKRIEESRDYVTSLDAATGDGDHWVNMNMGFQALVTDRASYETMALPEMFKAMGMKLMNSIGGSSGVLYGSAYLAAAKTCKGMDALDTQGVYQVLKAMLDAIEKRGNTLPGQKTMVDAIAPAVDAFRDNLGKDNVFDLVSEAAIAGAESTRDMEAVRGRACYQSDKGVGHLDPGAVTMAYQIDTWMKCLKEL